MRNGLEFLPFCDMRTAEFPRANTTWVAASVVPWEEHRRRNLSDEARRQLTDQAGTKWLGLVEDWAEPFFELPAWMRPDAMDIDNTRKIQSKDPNKPQRQSIKFEAVWLEDFP